MVEELCYREVEIRSPVFNATATRLGEEVILRGQ